MNSSNPLSAPAAHHKEISTDTISVGDVTITRVVEWQAALAPVQMLFPDTDREVWRRNQQWLAPAFYDVDTAFYKAVVQTWIVRSEGRTILVDTGLGNDRERPYMPPWSRLDTPFLDRLAAAGTRPADVDIVVNTHVHADHVGWNTTLVDREWVPTFGNARYLVAAADVDYWNPLNGHAKHGSFGPISAAYGNQNMFEDSVRPILEHDKAVLWEGGYRLDNQLTLEPAPGHTPGSAVLVARSGGELAFLIGDVMHTPLQIVEPGCETCLSEDAPAAVRQRRRWLERAAAEHALLLPAHLPGPGGVRVRREGNAFAVDGWAAFQAVEPS